MQRIHRRAFIRRAALTVGAACAGDQVFVQAAQAQASPGLTEERVATCQALAAALASARGNQVESSQVQHTAELLADY